MNMSIPQEIIETKIFIIRGQKVMLDRDLAELYGVMTKRLNEQVKRNIHRFPEDFMFQLNSEEKQQLVANCDRFKTLKHSTTYPYAFSEHGVIMLAAILNSTIAISVSVQIVRTFVRLREFLLTHRELKQKIEELESKYDHQFKLVFDTIKQFLQPPDEPKKKYGFLADRE